MEMTARRDPGLRPQNSSPWLQKNAQRYDYCLLPYTPRQTLPDDLMSVNLLLWSWEAHGVRQEGEALLQRLTAKLGPGHVVWGIKHHHLQVDSPTWEFYFYRRPHSCAELSLDTIARLFAPIAVHATLPNDLAWLMFSIEVNVHQLRAEQPTDASVYLETSGHSYRLRANQPPELENHYVFRDPQSAMADILTHLRASVHAPKQPITLAKLLPPQLLDCLHVCVANKRRTDAVYWSRIDTHQLEWFLHTHDWPQHLRQNLRTFHQQFKHVQWDVGADFQRSPSPLGFTFVKSGIYGSL